MQNGEKSWNTMPIQPEVLMGWLQTEKVSIEIHLLVDCLWLDLVAGIIQQALGKILAGWLLKKAWEAALQPNWLGSKVTHQDCTRAVPESMDVAMQSSLVWHKKVAAQTMVRMRSKNKTVAPTSVDGMTQKRQATTGN